MKLYYVPGACSLSPHIALREANLPFKLDRINVKAGKKTQTGADYVQLNPKGYVPALELDDGQILTEGAVIVQYLADLKPESKLAPPNGTLARVRLQEWLHYLATELHKGFSPLYSDKAGDEFKVWWRANKVEPRLEFLARNLEGKSFLMGDTFTVADGYAFYLLRAWQNPLKGDLSKWKVLQDYYARIGERPSVKGALEAEAAPV
jgi:glutathione S-transferase